MTQDRSPDVLLCYGHEDRQFGEMVAEAFADAGLSTYKPWTAAAGAAPDGDPSWDALLECAAVVGVIRSDGIISPTLLVAIGAAKMWDKPVYVVTDTVGPLDVPAVVAALPTYPVSKMGAVVDAVRGGAAPLGAKQRAALSSVYARHGAGIRDMLKRSPTLEQLRAEYRRAAGASVSIERLARELMRLRRKRGAGARRSRVSA
jgi:hypothetical protein